jgi:hypothetical protein
MSRGDYLVTLTSPDCSNPPALSILHWLLCASYSLRHVLMPMSLQESQGASRNNTPVASYTNGYRQKLAVLFDVRPYHSSNLPANNL